MRISLCFLPKNSKDPHKKDLALIDPLKGGMIPLFDLADFWSNGVLEPTAKSMISDHAQRRGF